MDRPALEVSSLVALSVNCNATPSMNIKDQEMLRDPNPFSIALRSEGGGGKPIYSGSFNN